MGNWVRAFLLLLWFLVGGWLTGCLFAQPSQPPTAVSQPTPLAFNQRQDTPTTTAPPTQPPPTATPILPPTPTYNPTIADWTVLIYLDADNNLEQAALLDLQEMVAAGTSSVVNIVIQIDRAGGNTAVSDPWTTTRRYLLNADNPDPLVAPPLMELGERNMGDPAELADFIQWGIQSYPANRFALIIWDHGAGWNGIAFDENATTPDSADHITLQDLKDALNTGLANSGIAKLDVIGFDACLMGQLDVFHAIEPFAQFGVGSEELTPGLGWDYTTLLAHLYNNPQMDGAQFARQMVTDFSNYYTEIEPDQFVTMSAIDLSQLPALTTAVTQLAEQITAVSSSVASAVGDARSGAESFARVYANEYERYAAIDLRHFAQILAQRSPSEAVNQAAQQVVTAVDHAVFAHEMGNAFQHSAGIAVYFPRNRDFYDPAYQQVTALPAWATFLDSYYSVGFTALPAPELTINNVLTTTIGAQRPGFVDFEIVGREIENVVVMAAREDENGRLQLVEYDNLIPEPTLLPDGTEIIEWRDGVHEDFFVWNTQVTYLYDQFDNGDYVVMWPTEYGSSLFTVQGQLRRADTGALFEVNLVFDHALGQMTRIWSYDSASKTAVSELLPQAGDQFILSALFIDEAQIVNREPSTTFTFGDDGQLYFKKRPLPSGQYQFSLQAENIAGTTATDSVIFTVNNEELIEGYTAYLDPYLGFQFLYPQSWYRPTYDQALLYTSDRTLDQQFQMRLYPNLETAVDLPTLKSQLLTEFGAIDILFEDQVVLENGTVATRVTYGYTAVSGERLGQFILFIKNSTGFAIDLDGAAELETATLETMAQLISSWQFAPAHFATQPGRWTTQTFEAFTVGQPADFVYSQFNEWQRFSSGQYIFVALRVQQKENAHTLERLIQDAGAGVAAFQTDQPYLFGLNGQIWERVDFGYTAADETKIWGYIMVREEGNQRVVAWVEAPTAVYNQLETAVFLTIVADLQATTP